MTVVKHNHLILADLLREFPTAAAGLTLEQFVKAMPALKPRQVAVGTTWLACTVWHLHALWRAVRGFQVLLNLVSLGNGRLGVGRGRHNLSPREGA